MNAEILSQLRSKPYFTNIYDPIEVLGKGGFGIVVKVRKNLTGELIALKIATKKHDRTNWDAKNEVEVHKKLVHPNIVKFISVEPIIYRIRAGNQRIEFISSLS